MIDQHSRSLQNLTGQLYFVCKRCWIYLRHVSELHEPCRGCAMMDSMDWEFWTPGRGRSAWWRHPCWMFMIMFFNLIRFPLDYWSCDDFPKLAHPSQTLYRQLSRMVQLTPFVQTFFPETHWILEHFDFTQDWMLIELFCVQSFPGVTPRGRHTRPTL